MLQRNLKTPEGVQVQTFGAWTPLSLFGKLRVLEGPVVLRFRREYGEYRINPFWKGVGAG